MLTAPPRSGHRVRSIREDVDTGSRRDSAPATIVSVRTDERLGTLDDVLALADGDVRDLLVQVRGLIIALHPDTVEVPRPGERSVAYGHGPKKMSEAYVYLMPHARHLNLGFYHGVNVPDPEGLLEGSGKALRHVKLGSAERAASPAIRRLIEQAIVERRPAPTA